MADLDAILDSALDDFEEQQLAEKTNATSNTGEKTASEAQKTVAQEKEKKRRAGACYAYEGRRRSRVWPDCAEDFARP